MSQIKLMLQVGIPTETRAPEYEKPSVEERVRDAIECIESGYKSDVQWLLLNKLYTSLSKKPKLSPRARNIVQMIEPLLAKYGYHKVGATE